MCTLRLLRFRLAKYTLCSSTLRRSHLARQIAADRLDLDHVGTEVGEQHPAERAGEDVPHLEDADAGERPSRRHDRSELGADGGEERLRPMPRLDPRRAVGAQGKDPDREVRGTRVAEAPEPRHHGGLVARSQQVADVAGVALLEQPLVVRRVLGVAEQLVRPARAPRRPRRSRTAPPGCRPRPAAAAGPLPPPPS